MKEWILTVAAQVPSAEKQVLEGFFVRVDRGNSTHQVMEAKAGFELMSTAELFEFYQVLTRLTADAHQVMQWHAENAVKKTQVEVEQ